ERVNTVVACAVNPYIQGVVHINIPLEGNYDSTEVAPGWQMPQLSALAAFGRRDKNGALAPMRPFDFPKPAHGKISEICKQLQLQPGLRGLIVAGPECPLSNEELNRFSGAVGFPVLADAASGLRRPEVAHMVTAFDTLIAYAGGRSAPPQLVIRLGLEPTLTMVHDYLLNNSCPTIKIANHPSGRDCLHPEYSILVRPDRCDLDNLAKALAPGNRAWLAHWKNCGDQARVLRNKILTTLPWGEAQAASIICNSEYFEFIHAANSMSIRNADMYCDPAQWSQCVFSNRGVNGIDGTLGTFVGELVNTKKMGVLLIGDLAFIHDLPALACREREQVNGCICVMNNGGGAIFDFLSAARLPGYQDTVRNTVEIDIEAAAACFRLPYCLADSELQLCMALHLSVIEGGLHLIEVRVPPQSGVNDYVKVSSGVREGLAEFEFDSR
ncbi:MAG: hypothetical protein ACXWJK_11200, partial [Burkholderiaceae bacterium]